MLNQKMDFNLFQAMSERTMPNGGIMVDGKVFYSAYNVTNYGMGLAGKTGEVVDMLHKVLHYQQEFNREEFVFKAGRVLQYLSGLCTMYDVTLEEIATENLMVMQDQYSKNREDDV